MNSAANSIKKLFILFCTGISCIGCNNSKENPTLPPPVKVTVTEVSPHNEKESREYSGTVSSEETTTVSFTVAGIITDLYAEEGQKVNKGQQLGKLREGEYLNAYNIAEAQLAEAQDGYDRLKKLHDANALPDIKWVEIQQKLKQARNAVEMAQRTLNDTKLHSPVAGTVTRKFADVGQNVMPVEPVYEIVSTKDLTIDISVSENEIKDFAPGDKAEVYMKATDLGVLEGKVVRKSVTADPLTRSFTVKVSLPNTQGKILPGMIGTVKFSQKEISGNEGFGVTLPSQALMLNEDNRWFVWVVNDSVASRRFVKAEQLTADGVLVTEGLRSGDYVIVEGMQKVGTGTRVDPLRESGL